MKFYIIPLCFLFFSVKLIAGEVYPGKLNIPVNKLGLSPELTMHEALFSRLLQNDIDLTIDPYNAMPSTKGGLILDPDIVRSMYPAYADGFLGPVTYVLPTHRPSSAFIGYLFDKKLTYVSEEDPTPHVVFMAGGGGSGKELTKKLIGEVLDSGDFILDGTLANRKKAFKRIEQSLKMGVKVSIIYVYRPVEKAVVGMIQRSIITGRAVPILVAASAHYNAQMNVWFLDEFFGDKIDIYVIDNSGELGTAKVISDFKTFLDEVAYRNEAEVIIKALRAFNTLS